MGTRTRSYPGDQERVLNPEHVSYIIWMMKQLQKLIWYFQQIIHTWVPTFQFFLPDINQSIPPLFHTHPPPCSNSELVHMVLGFCVGRLLT